MLSNPFFSVRLQRRLVLGIIVTALLLKVDRLVAQNYSVQGNYVPPSTYQTRSYPAPQQLPQPYQQRGTLLPQQTPAQPQLPYSYQQAPVQPAPKAKAPAPKKPTPIYRPATPSSAANQPRSSSSSTRRSRYAEEEEEYAPAYPEAEYDPYPYPDTPAPRKKNRAEGFEEAVAEDIADLWENDRRQDQRLTALERGSRPSPRPSTDSTRYTVRYGDSLSEIAAHYGTSVAALKSANGLRSDVLLEGQTLVVPGSSRYTPAPSPTPRRSSSSSNSGTHYVKRGESLSGIASSYGVSLTALKAANGIRNADIITVGQRLSLPAGSSSTPKKAPAPKKKAPVQYVKSYSPPKPEKDTPPSGKTVTYQKPGSTVRGIASYRVEQGDTLDSIASTFNTKPDEVRRLNALTTSYKPVAGDELVVPSPAPMAL